MTDTVWRPPGWTPITPTQAPSKPQEPQDTGRCGTLAGRSVHQRRGEKLCEPCREARNAYVRQQRTDPRVAAVHKRDQSARDRAMRKLARLHPDEFQRLFDAEKNAMRGDTP